MKLTVLMDNNTLIDAYYLGEPAVSYYIEDDNEKILFDTAYSSVYTNNAKKLGIDLKLVDIIVLSHGHDDHTGGLDYMPKRRIPYKVVAHKDTFEKKLNGDFYISSPVSLEELSLRFSMKLTNEPLKVSKHITFLGEIPRTNNFENKHPVGVHLVDNKWEKDFVKDDSALVYEGKDGIYVITGCSHSGICNIIEYAKKVTGKTNVLGVIGGFHLMHANSRQLDATCEYFKNEKIKELYPCHCTCFAAKMAINNVSPIKEVGVSLQLEWL